jgi:PAS domain S-box-containing protein
MFFPHRWSKVRHKLLAGVLLTSLAGLAVAGIALLAYDLQSYESTRVSDWNTQAEIIGRASAPALQFEDPGFANSNLALLSARPEVEAAALYNAKGALFAKYVRKDGTDHNLAVLPESDGARVEGNSLHVFRRIVDNGEIVGTIYIRAYYGFYERMWSYVLILMAVSALALGVSLVASAWLQRHITRPILNVTGVARKVVENRDYSLRASKMTNDEIAYLVDAFNNMLAEIGRQTEALESSNKALEAQIAERAGAERALRDSERRNRTLVEASTSIVWMADKDRHFPRGQPGWQAYTGQTDDDSAGAGWRSAFLSEDREVLEQSWKAAVETRSPFVCELRLWHAASAQHRYISLRAAPVLDTDGQVVEWIGTVADVDDRRRAEEEIRRLNAELEERVARRTAELEATNKELESFSYSVSHDLRAPLRAIDGYSRMVQEDYKERLDEDGQRMLGVVREEAVKMGRLIDDLLAFSKLSRKAMDADQVDMTALAQETAKTLLREHDEQRIRLDIWPLPPVKGDPALLRQVWVNLLSNALKYSSTKPKAEILVSGEQVDGSAHFRVQDNGVGFDMKYAPKLFGVFQRLHKAEDFEGTGVGLAIVQRVVLRHGGSIRADAKPGEGATFHFTLPVN